MNIMKKSLGYNDVGLISRHVSTISSRLDVTTSIKFSGIGLGIPLIVSPMPDIGNSQLINEVSRLGGFGYLHRFQPISDQVANYQRCSHVTGCAIGVTGDYQERFLELYNRGCRNFCLDTANGAHIQVGKAIGFIKNNYKDVYIIVGNVASRECFRWLEEFGINGIRTGISGGSACTTKLATGLEHPMISTIMECEGCRQTNVNIIADGGIKQPSDFCKALAFGADVVMVGGILGGTEESSGKTIRLDNKLYKMFRGAASYSAQQDYIKSDPKFVEGEEQLLPYTGSVEKVIRKFKDGLRSSMSYMNAKNLKEYRDNMDWCIL